MAHRFIGTCAAVAFLAGQALATDGVNALIVIDPTDPVSLAVGHYYQNARSIPDHHVIYMPITTSGYAAFRQFQLPIVRSVLVERGIEELVDFVVLAPSVTFANGASGLFVDGCSPVNRFSITSAYASVFLDDVFAAGGTPILYSNPYGRPAAAIPLAFSGLTSYSLGLVNPGGSRLLISSLLGYTGVRGNSVQEIYTMIDRSVASDGTEPNGTVYFMRTTDAARSAPRHNIYPTVVNEIVALGDNAVQLMANLPIGQNDAIGVMSGFASTNIDNANFTLLPGAFADHLTSFAATFDNSSQTKASEWIRKGASGTFGAVEEPCNYSDKFPHARMHLYYHQGLPLGAAVWRSLGAFPVQGLLLGDPLTNPYDIAPTAQILVAADAPAPGSAQVFVSTATAKPGTGAPPFARVYVDGQFKGVVLTSGPLTLNTLTLADGWHEVRAFAADNTAVRSDVSVATELVVSNLGRSATFVEPPASGDLSDTLVFAARSDGPDAPSEIRLLQNGRVIAAAPGSGHRFRVPAGLLGEGTSRVQVEALYADGMVVRSAPHTITLTSGSVNPAPAAPTSFNTVVMASPGQQKLIHLPFATDGDLTQLSFTIVQGPSQATVNTGSGDSAVLLSPNANATGMDRLTYRVTGPGGTSATATVRISYSGTLPDDRNGDGSVDIEDLHLLAQTPADINGDGLSNSADLALLEDIVRGELTIERRP